MTLSRKPLKGMRQLAPGRKRIEDYIITRLREAGVAYGFEEYETPVLEPLELFLAKSGSELAVDQSYNFTDKGGRKLIMRPELTPSLARMVAASGELIYPVKWMSFPVCYRYERPQRGRVREGGAGPSGSRTAGAGTFRYRPRPRPGALESPPPGPRPGPTR